MSSPMASDRGAGGVQPPLELAGDAATRDDGSLTVVTPDHVSSPSASFPEMLFLNIYLATLSSPNILWPETVDQTEETVWSGPNTV